jgi:hypothetical protein
MKEGSRAFILAIAGRETVGEAPVALPLVDHRRVWPMVVEIRAPRGHEN